ncbi:hypothetical protein BY458DRAFT_589835, partial [Sporodiniella umbellata]
MTKNLQAIEESKRQVELTQLKARYKSTYQVAKDDEIETIVRLDIRPTDPDFPFELNALRIKLHVPLVYPTRACQIEVINTDIPKGFAINLEKGFGEYANSSSTSLVKQMNWLDRNLESLLQQAPVSTVRFVSHADQEDKRHLEQSSIVRSQMDKQVVKSRAQQTNPFMPQHSASSKAAVPPTSTPAQQPSPTPRSESFAPQHPPARVKIEKYTEKQKALALSKRQQEIQQLEARFCDSYKLRTYDTLSLILNINDADLHYDLKPFQLKYIVPILYPLEPCSIDIENKNVDETRKSWVRSAFDGHDRSLTLFEKLNWMNSHLPSWWTTPVKVEEKKPTLSASAPSFVPASVLRPRKMEDFKRNKVVIVNDPSLLLGQDDDDSLQSESDSDLGDSDHDPSEPFEESQEPIYPAQPLVRRGIDIRLVEPILDNVQLLRCRHLNVVVQCSSCKHSTAVERLQPEKEEGQTSHTRTPTERWFTCATCSSAIGLKFFGALVHPGAHSLGLLQTSGCTVQDILPSSFLGTCGTCLTDMTSATSLSFHSSPQTLSCFDCHGKMTLGLNAYHLVKLGDESLKTGTPQMLKKKKKREEGIVLGQALSNQGTCAHYRKSKRWFRFPCCHRLYACDVCHDSHEDHSYEIARRHVCGLCSREQAIVLGKPCPCGQTFEKVVHKGAFWEGGKGVRN